MFKRLLIASVISSVLVSGASFAGSSHQNMGYKGEALPAMAPAPVLRPYVGVNYVYIHQNYVGSVTETIGGTTTTFNPGSTSPNNFSGASLDAGFKYGQYMGMEFGYFQAGSKSQTTGNTKVTLQPLGAYMDLRGYLPIQNWDIYGIAGVVFNSLGDAHVQSATTNTTIRSDSTIAPRLGLGVDYNFNQNFGARVEAKYAFVQSNYVNNVMSYSAGLYYFLF